MHFLGKTLLVFALLHSIFQGQICLLLKVFLDFLLLHSRPLRRNVPPHLVGAIHESPAGHARLSFQNMPFQRKPFDIMVIQGNAPNCNAEEAEVEQFYEDYKIF